MSGKLIITIDGPSGAGKSIVSQLLAERLKYKYIDTGALYRVVALKVKQENIDPENEDELYSLCSKLNVSFDQKNGQLGIFLEGKDVTEKIRVPEMSLFASKLSAKRVVRDALLGVQRKLGNGGGVVMEGRDIGTVVFPEAEVKIFLDASLEVRGKRRFKQYLEKGQVFDLSQITRETEKRDFDDSKRALSPLKPADGATVINSTKMSIEEVVGEMLKVIKQHLPSSSK
jgi:cytidylate kinase